MICGIRLTIQAYVSAVSALFLQLIFFFLIIYELQSNKISAFHWIFVNLGELKFQLNFSELNSVALADPAFPRR